ncbi:uncharacterized protein TRIVIDRAFT_219998 [Trichoderma virens Gv29-8]|uniref:Zn(2)-C6 fungal-type domain-containing protein n=1 Tax=Hypocrea virens (strain Gv29-8 / FGSC 10586) TaxID=413071 RepID=G9MMH7_HYPVG|nr:uncharacterized protein TRIVIDRAFT_219998 [Trichoderma virens Gv29-8]EHK24546.1 hypothetical protein TRIVIDRAFT_219998 [Trichoderma virens Gv29-8]
MEVSTVPCTLCRKRRVKCDKRLPGCARCEKASRSCPGYNHLRRFLDESQNLRKKFSSAGASPQASGLVKPVDSQLVAEAASTVSSFSGSLDSSLLPTAASGSIDVAQTQATTPTSADAQLPSQDDALHGSSLEGADHDSFSTNQGVHDTSFITTESISDSDFDARFFDIDPQIYFADGNNCCGFIPSLSLINDANGPQGPSLSWLGDVNLEGYSQPGYEADAERSERSERPETEFSSPMPDSSNEADHETAYLIRYFAERISPCLDVFDIERFFGHIVPIKAIRSPLLQNALAAIAAKQFGKTKRETYSANHQTPGRSMLEQYSEVAHIDWFYKAASFYDKAIGHMMRLLQTLRDGSPSPPPGTPSSMDLTLNLHSAVSPSFKRRRIESSQSSHNVVDDLLAAISVFLLYESLDNRFAEVSRHMSGAQYLLTFNLKQIFDSTEFNPRGGASSGLQTRRAWQASFWNIVCIDWVTSYTGETPPRIDIENLELWKAAGLPMCVVNGIHLPVSLCNDETSGHQMQMTETMACRSLIWVILKTLAFVAAEKGSNKISDSISPDAGKTDRSSLHKIQSWDDISQHLDNWCAALPDTFEPCARIAQRYNNIPTPSDNMPPRSEFQSAFQELFYANAMCATAAVLYHFVQLLLLLHKPLNQKYSESHAEFVAKRLNAYRQLSAQIEGHANEICAISLGRPDDPVRLHMVQPLYIAGLCFEAHEQRTALAQLLATIQRETGYSTAERVANLQQQWGWDSTPPALDVS